MLKDDGQISEARVFVYVVSGLCIWFGISLHQIAKNFAIEYVFAIQKFVNCLKRV